MTQRRRVATRPRAFSTDDVNEIQARRIDERKGAFGEVPEWDPTMFRGSKTKLMFNKAYYCTPEPLRSSIKLPTSCADWKSFFLIRVPIIQWLWSYQAKHLIGDLVAGLTIGMTHIPQGIGFALLAQLPVVHGLYASFVPVIIYSIFGTSRHISVGTFPVVALMVGTAVQRLSECSDMIVATNGTSDGDIINTTVTVCDNDPVDIAVTLAMMVGVLMIMASVLQLGFITLFLSDALVSSYTCAASFVIFTTQIRFLLGLDPSDSKVDPGLFDTPRKFIRYMDLLFHGGANAGAVVTSFLCILFLIVMDYVNMFIKKKFPHFPFPIPSQIILVIIATAISFCAKLSDAPIRLPVVDDIPTGAPPFTPPDFSLLSQLITDAITIMIVSYVINISQAKLLAKKHSYTLYPNQEFLAYGMMNFAGSLFGGFATAGALSRSILQDITGGCTQLVGLVSSVIVFIVILFLGTLFEPLPEATLATIIIVALKGLYLQVKDAKQSWVISKPDMLVWVVVFVCTLFIGLDIGLLIGVTFSMLQIIMFTILPHSPSLGVIDMWQLDKEIYEKKGNPVKGVFIFQFQAPLYFANISIFRQRLSLGTGIDPLVIKVDEQKEPGCFKACFHKIRYKEHVYNLEESVENGMRTVIDGTNNYVQTIQKYTTSSLPHTPQPFQEMSDISDLTITGGGTEGNIEENNANNGSSSMTSTNSPPHQQHEEEEYNFSQLLSSEDQTRTDRQSWLLGNIESLSHRLRSVSKAYHHQHNTLTKSHHHNTNRMDIIDESLEYSLPYHTIIIDCAPIAFVDQMGAKALYQLINEYDKLGIQVLLAAPTYPVLAKLKIIDFFQRFGPQWVFPSIQGAVEFAKSGQKVTPQLAQEYLDYQFQNWEERQIMHNL